MVERIGWQLVQPAVLTGGRSRRFGRDKLVEPMEDSLLIDRPIGALRGVFGPRVAVVGACSDRVASRGDLVIPDPYPGVGPIGGVLAALEYSRGAVFVLAGDLVAVDGETIRRVLDAAAGDRDSLAVLATTDRPQPCLGLYRPAAAEHLRRALAAERYGLGRALPAERVCRVGVPAASARNVNRPVDLGSV